MNAVAYCRVSTLKEGQLDSLESQQSFFMEYAKRNQLELIKIYADEGKSGTNLKNRIQLLKLLEDARGGRFGKVLIKDVSRLARNTVDFLTSIRYLKSLGISVIFVNYDQTTSESSEFMLTMLSAIAQEESANTSKRVKFGKRLNAEKGRVPNLLYGYTKIPGDYFDLCIHESESKIVRRIFNMYVNDGFGTTTIAHILNSEHIKTKRGFCWTPNTVKRILSNEIYIGNIINGKQEVIDFLTGTRENKTKESWIICKKPELAIVEEEMFYRAQEICANKKLFLRRPVHGELFRKLIVCKECDSFFRKISYHCKDCSVIKWVCAGRNLKGKAYCSNHMTLEEEFLKKEIVVYFLKYLSHYFFEKTIEAFQIIYKNTNRIFSANDTQKMLKRLQGQRNRLIELFEDELICKEELTIKMQHLNERISLHTKRLKKTEDELDYHSFLIQKLDDLKKDKSKLLAYFDIAHIIGQIDCANDLIKIFIKSFEDIKCCKK